MTPGGSQSLTRWTVGAVLTLLMALVMALSSFAFAQVNNRLSEHERRVTGLEVAFATMAAQQQEMHRSQDMKLDRIEMKLDRLQARAR